MENKSRKILCLFLAMLLTITSVGAKAPKVQAEETEETVTITFIDNTEEK